MPSSWIFPGTRIYARGKRERIAIEKPAALYRGGFVSSGSQHLSRLSARRDFSSSSAPTRTAANRTLWQSQRFWLAVAICRTEGTVKGAAQEKIADGAKRPVEFLALPESRLAGARDVVIRGSGGIGSNRFRGLCVGTPIPQLHLVTSILTAGVGFEQGRTDG